MKLKQITKFIAICVLMVLSSCEKDLYEDAIKSNSSSIQMTDVSLSTLNTNVANKINQKISDLKREVNKNEAAKFEYDSSLNIYIDTENGKLIQLDGKLFYTFPMFRKSEEKLDNIIFTPKNNEELEVYLAKYNVKPEEYTSYTNNENLEAVYEKFGAGQLCVDMVSTTIVYPDCPYANGVHPNGERCKGETKVDIITICSNDGGGSGNAGGLGTMGGIGTPGGNHESGIGAATPDLIMTVPIGLTQDQIKTKDFILGLSEEQSNWYFSQELQTTNNIVRYLVQNNFSAESVSFVSEIINASQVLEINAMLVWEDYDNFRNQMSSSEKIIFDGLSSNRKLWYMCSAKKARDKAEELFPLNSLHNGKGDAFRHALWNGLCALTLAGNLGEQLTTAHENKPAPPNDPFNYKETEMDLYNNEKGRQVAILSNLTNITDHVLQDLNNGYLRYLNNLNPVNGQATYNSLLIPTNQ